MSSGRITISVSFYLFPFVLIASRYQDYGNGEGVANIRQPRAGNVDYPWRSISPL